MIHKATFLTLATFCFFTIGCKPEPVTWNVAMDKLDLGPYRISTNTSGTISFRLTCTRSGGTGKEPIPITIKIVFRVKGANKVIHESVPCSFDNSKTNPAFVGNCKLDLGKIDLENPELGKRAQGYQEVEIEFKSNGHGWAMPTPIVVLVPVMD